MNIDNILDNEHWMFLEDNTDVAYYSLTIGLDEFFSTYHAIYLKLKAFDKSNRNYINEHTKDSTSYIKCYLNIAIHIQHFFELETKRILENEHKLYAVDDKGDPIILYKLLNGQTLDAEDTKELKSVEFSEAIVRLKKLVDNGIIQDEVAKILVNNFKLLRALNQLRNTIIHRGKRIMLYCDIDDLFATHLLPVIKEIIECKIHESILSRYKDNGYYDAICAIIAEGKSASLDYSKIAYAKEIGRCKNILSHGIIEKGKEDKTYVEKIIAKRLKPWVEEVHLKGVKCPCCDNEAMFEGRELIGFDIDELGDETSSVGGFRVIQIPEYAIYRECGLCGFAYTDFIHIT